MTTFDLHAELARLAAQFHHLRGERAREKPGGRSHRILETRALEARERFELLLDRWVPDDDLRARWRARFDNRADEPDEPFSLSPMLFKGRTDAGDVVEVHRGDDGPFQVKIDGKLAARVAALGADPARQLVGLVGEAVVEEFDAPEEARAALLDWVRAPHGQPPWQHALALAEDGLIDPGFGLTLRGHRFVDRVA